MAWLFALGLLFAASAAHAQSVSGVTVSANGSGYSSPPSVVFTGGGGSGAVATAVMASGGVASVVVTVPGTGYTSAPTVSFTGGGGSGAAAFAVTANLVFTSAPNRWAVIGGAYRYTPSAETSAPAATITFNVIQSPSWLTYSSGQLSGTPPTSEQGLNDLVVIEADDTASNIATQSYHIIVGNAVGPTNTPPGGGTAQWVTGMPQVARSGGDTEVISGVNNASTIPIFWGLAPSGFAMSMDYPGPSGAGGADFTVPGDFSFAPLEIGDFYALGSSLSLGIGQWQGQTSQPASIGGATVYTWLSAAFEDLNLAAAPLTSADMLGLDNSVGAVGQVNATEGLRVIMWLDANEANPFGTPALDWFNALPDKLPTDRTVTQVSSGFYWVNTSPKLQANNGASVLQDGTVILTTAMLDASDNEQGPGEISFNIPSDSSGFPPYAGDLQVDDGSGQWATTLGAGGSFTLAQVQAGWVRYVNLGSFSTSDNFQFGVTDGYGGYARDGNFTVFSFGINITLIEHAPVAGSPSITVGVGATGTGTLDFTDPDQGYLADTYTVSFTDSTALGTLMITDASTGAYSFTAGGATGNDIVDWQVTNGPYTADGTLTITVNELPPTLSPLSITGGASAPITGTLLPIDPNVAPGTFTFSVDTPPTKGSVSFIGSQVNYTATAGRFGTDSFTVVATDNNGMSSPAETVSVTIVPDTITDDTLFISGSAEKTMGGQQGVIQRVNPVNGDIYTVATGLGNQARGMAWWPEAQKLLVIFEVDSPSFNGIVAVDPITGAWTMANIVTGDGQLTFPINLSAYGPDHVLVSNGGSVIDVTISTGDQQALSLGLPGTAFVSDAVLSPDGSGKLWLTDDEFMENPDNSTVYLADPVAGTATMPVTFSPAGDPGSIFVAGPNEMAVARGGVPVETIQVNPVAYTPLPGSPTAPYFLPVGLTSFAPIDSWLVVDAADGLLYSQAIGTTDVEPVTITGLSSAFGVFVLSPATHFTVSGPTTATAASPTSVTVTALDANNKPAYYSGTIHFTSSDGGAVLPSDSVITNGNGSFSVTLYSAGPQTVTATDTVTSSITGTSGSIAVAAGPATHLSVVAPSTALPGSAVSVTVSALDAGNNFAASYTGTVHFSSTGGTAILPANAALVSGAGSFLVTFEIAGPNTVTATDVGTPSINGTSGTVAVGSAPAITVQPLPQNVSQGSSAQFSVTATGYPTPTYQWFLGGVIVPGATSSSLTLNNVQPANAGNYTVTATNFVSVATSKAASLVVNAGPVITTQPVTVTVNTGGNATFTVVATGSPVPTYQWTLNGTPISGATRASITVSKVTTANAGNYVVTARNSYGMAVSSTAVLVVNTAPQITAQPSSQLVNVSAGASFTVVATGIPAPTYQWYLGGVLLPGATSSTLSIPTVQLSNAGSYTVIVTNSVSSVTSSAAILTVNGSPMITTQPASVTVVAGNDPIFTVVATGNPAPTYQWSLNSSPISGATKASLTIINAKDANAGTYTVTVTNTKGSTLSIGAVLTVVTPPSITTQPVSKTVTTGATVKFTVVASGSATLTYQWSLGGVSIPSATSSSLSLTNVQPSSNGTYTVTVTNSAGNAVSHGAVLKVN